MTKKQWFEYKVKESLRQLDAIAVTLQNERVAAWVTDHVPVTSSVRAVQDGYRAMMKDKRLFDSRVSYLMTLLYLTQACPEEYKAWAESPYRTHQRLTRVQEYLVEAETIEGERP